LNKVTKNPAELKSKYADDEIALFMDMTVVAKDGRRYTANPGVALKGMSELRQIPDTVQSQSLVFLFNGAPDQGSDKFKIGIKESGAITDLITLKVYEFPMINILWIGVVVMVIGFIMSIIQRVKRNPGSIRMVS